MMLALTPRPGPATWKQLAVLTLLASLLPIYLLVSLPPLWISVDSIVLTTWRIGDGVFPHYPPLYPLFTRSINYLTMWLFCEDSGAAAELAFNFSDVGIYAIVGIQHALGVIALVTFSMVAARSLSRRLLVLLMLLLNPTYFLSTHALATEALWLPLITLAFAGILSIWRARQCISGLALAGYFLVLYFNFLVRHTGIVIAGMLPALLALRALATRSRPDVVRWLGVTVLTCLAFLAAHGSAEEACDWFEVEPRSIWGRAAVYRLAVLDWQAIGLDEKARLIAQMQSRTQDPLVYQAIPRAFRDKNVWRPLWIDIGRMVEVENPGISPAARDREADRILNEVCRLFYLSAGEYLWAAVREDVFAYLRAPAGREYSYYILNSTRQTYAMFLANADFQRLYRNLSICDPSNLPAVIHEVSDFHKNDPYIRNTEWYSQHTVLGILFGLALLAWILGRLDGKYLLFTIVALGSVVGYFVLISTVTIVSPRYVVYGPNVFAICLASFVGALRIRRLPLSPSVSAPAMSEKALRTGPAPGGDAQGRRSLPEEMKRSA